jgi:hypothetical protein
MNTSFSITPEGALFEFGDGIWRVIAKNGAVAQFEKFPAAFFPLLEVSTRELIQSHPGSQKFPWKELIESAATSPSEYWQKLSLDRIEEMEMFVSCATAVKELADQGLTQGIRHQAQRLTKRAEI